MKTMIVDDEEMILKRFERLAKNIPEIEIIGRFRDPLEALLFADKNPVELAFLDIGMPVMDGLILGRKLREIKPGILIVFATAYDDYIREANQMGADYYIMKPFDEQVLRKVTDNMLLLMSRQKKNIYIQAFGRFVVKKDDKPVAISGKAKEILAYLVSKHGREVSNLELFQTIWENREYNHANMTVFYNALKRLKNCLQENSIEDILLSSTHGQMVDTAKFECDYYHWIDGKYASRDDGEYELMIEYSWAEALLAEIYQKKQKTGEQLKL